MPLTEQHICLAVTGSVSCIGVGKSARHTMSLPISWHLTPYQLPPLIPEKRLEDHVLVGAERSGFTVPLQ
jgi:hypothetical protein